MMYKKRIARLMVFVLLCGLLPMQDVWAAEMDATTQAPVTEAETTEKPATTEAETTEKPATTEAETTEKPTTETQGTEGGATETPTPGGIVSGDAVSGDAVSGDAAPEETVPEGCVLTGLSPAKAKVVVLDPGHGKTHSGAAGNGLREEQVVLDIAKACKDKLDQYADITVYMTREDGTCCSKLGFGDCLSGRNNYAKCLDADFLISLHINAGSSNGANALVAYKSGYHDNVRKETQAFGKIALKKLEGLGIKNRGFLLRKSGTGNRYSNGKLADYYSIVRRGVEFDLPSMIIEHGYITSASDCSSFFKTKAKCTKVGNADADAIISYYGLKKSVINGKMKTQEGGTCFITTDGKKALGWVKYDGNWYFFDRQTGIMQTGMIQDEGENYFLNAKSGALETGWIKDGSVKYIARGDGRIVKNQVYCDGLNTYLFHSSGKLLGMGLHSVGGKTYYVNNKKHVLSGILNISGTRYFFDGDTKEMRYGLIKQGSKYYYADEKTGAMAYKTIKTVNGKKYYFGKSGVRQTGWVKYKGSQYYFAVSSAKMVTGWKKIKGKYYYFSKSTGKMQKKKWIGNYYVNSKGVRTKKK